MSHSAFLQQALLDSLSTGIFIDTKIYGFSKRGLSGHVRDPKALYANSHVLGQVPHFQKELSGSFVENATRDIRAFSCLDDEVSSDVYGYAADSDLEDDPPEVHDGSEATSPLTNDTPLDSLSDSVESVISDASTTETSSDMPHVSLDVDMSQLGHDGCFCDDNEPQTRLIHSGKVVIIKDIASTTLQSFLFYLYTGRIHFAPFGSEASRQFRKSENSAYDLESMPKSSPKSMYRLADKYDIPALRKLSFDYICASLENCDLVEELFSQFTSWYPELREAQAQHLAKILTSGDHLKTLNRLNEQIEIYTTGRLPHASEAFTALCRIVSNPRSPLQELGINGCHTLNTEISLSTLERALKKSFTTGTFLDHQMYARSSKLSSGIWTDFYHPIYLSRMVIDQEFDQSKTYATKLDTSAGVTSSYTASEADYESDSDFDDEGQDTVKNLTNSTCGIPENSSTSDAVVLTVGAATTWKALIFYLYTNRVSFAPLQSQGLEFRTKWIKEQHDISCSPKSFYALTKELGLSRLEDLAIDDIRSKMSAANLMSELFSRFTSSQPRIIATGVKLLSENVYNSQEMAEMMKKIIESVSDGNARYRSEALKSVLRELVECMRRASRNCRYTRARSQYSVYR